MPFGHTPTHPVNCNKLSSACTLETARFVIRYPNCVGQSSSFVFLTWVSIKFVYVTKVTKILLDK